MRNFITFIVLLTLHSTGLKAQNTAFLNGNWYTGAGFQSTTFYSVKGILTKKKPATVENTVDLAGGYVVPPYADAFSAGLADGPFQDRLLAEYTQNGAFYLQAPASTSSAKTEFATKLNKLDISMPITVIRMNGSTFKPEDYLDTLNYIAHKSSSIKGFAHDWFTDINDSPALKIALTNLKKQSGNYLLIDLYHPNAKPTKDHQKMLQKLVKYAHREKKSVHLIASTPEIWDIGVKAKVDVLVGLPIATWNGEGAYTPYLLTSDQFAALKKAKITVMPLLSYYTLTRQTPKHSEQVLSQLKEYFNQTLKNLAAAQIPLAIGSNNIGRNNHLEITQFFNVFADYPNNILQYMAVHTPRTIFPHRKIAYLEEGYEANFLVYKNNPLDRIQTYRTIDRKYKLGVEWKK